MFTSFSTALSALNATSTAIDVVGNNLANMNSTGFKTSDVSFSDLVTQSLGAGLGSTQVGFGTATPLTVRDFSQGALETSGGLLNGAISGQGFFVVQDPNGNTEYTRAGDFQTDKNGNLLTATGQYVQGWTTVDPTTGQVDTNGPVGNIVVPVGTLQPPVATSTLTADLNLNSAASADGTSTFSDPITIYDSLGTAHVLTLSFTKTDANTWTYTATLPAADLSDPTAAQVATGTLAFNPDGTMDFTNTSTPVTPGKPNADISPWSAMLRTLAPSQVRGVVSRATGATATTIGTGRTCVRAMAFSSGFCTPKLSIGKFTKPKASAGEPSFTR